MRTTSVLSYILLSLENAGMPVDRIETVKNGKIVEAPTEKDASIVFGVPFEKTKVDRMLLEGAVEFGAADQGIIARSGEKKIPILFDPERFRPAEVPILFADTTKIRQLGFSSTYSVEDIIRDQLNFYMDEKKRV